MDTKEQLLRINQSPSQRLARLSQHNPIIEIESTEPKAIEAEPRTIRLDPDIRAQMNLVIARDESNAALTATELMEGDRRQEIYYKVNDPAQFFINKADDLDRRPGQNEGQYRAYQQQMAKMWTDRFIKTHPEHGKGRIDRLSTHRKRKRKVEMASNKGKRYSTKERRRILNWADNKSIKSAAEHYGVSSTTIHNWKTSKKPVKQKRKGKKAKVSLKRG